MKHWKHVLCATAAAVLVWTAMPGFAVYAWDPDYSGYLDTDTSSSQSQGSASQQDSVSYVVLTDNMYYDTGERYFIFPGSSIRPEIRCTAGDGMVVNGKVSLIDPDPGVVVYKDGSEYSGELVDISDPGEYVVSYRRNSDVYRVFVFTIVGDVTGSLHSFTAPDGFYITAASVDGVSTERNRFELDMSREGLYQVSYQSYSAGLTFSFTTRVDNSAPEIRFSGKQDSDGRYRSAVKYTGMESGDTIVLLRSGTSVSPGRQPDGTGLIVDSGNYVMRVFDSAGNETVYEFTILMYFNTSTIIFFILLILFLGGGGFYILHMRRNVKIG